MKGAHVTLTFTVCICVCVCVQVNALVPSADISAVKKLFDECMEASNPPPEAREESDSEDDSVSIPSLSVQF